MEQLRNDIDRVKLKDSERNLSQCHFVHYKYHWTDLDANPDLRGEKSATNRLSYGTALRSHYTWRYSLAFSVPEIF
jgi:hypothetical protein